jgi:glycosyltransferase involved in cell wall biosynthesis
MFNAKLVRVVLTERPRIFHAVDLDVGMVGVVARKIMGMKFVYDIADWYSASRPQREWLRKASAVLGIAWFLDRVETWVAAQADCVILPHENRLVFLRREPVKWMVVGNAPSEEEVKEARAEGRSPGEYFAYVGTLYADRGIEVLLRVARAKRLPVVIAGTGPLERACRAAYEEAGRYVQFLGRVDYREALRIQAASRAVVLLYDPRRAINRMAAPYKLYEAMALGKPVIVSEGTWPAELVKNEGIGLAVKYGDEEALAEAMGYLWANEEEAMRLGARGRELFDAGLKYELECEKLCAAYKELLDQIGKNR